MYIDFITELKKNLERFMDLSIPEISYDGQISQKVYMAGVQGDMFSILYNTQDKTYIIHDSYNQDGVSGISTTDPIKATEHIINEINSSEVLQGLVKEIESLYEKGQI